MDKTFFGKDIPERKENPGLRLEDLQASAVGQRRAVSQITLGRSGHSRGGNPGPWSDINPTPKSC